MVINNRIYINWDEEEEEEEEEGQPTRQEYCGTETRSLTFCFVHMGPVADLLLYTFYS